MKKDKASIQKSNNDHYYAIMHLRLRSKRRQKGTTVHGNFRYDTIQRNQKKTFLPQPPYSHTSFSLLLILRPIKSVPPVPDLLITQTPEFSSHIPFSCNHHTLTFIRLYENCLGDDATSRKKLAKEDNMRGVCLAERCVWNIVQWGRRIREDGGKVLHWVSVKPVLLGSMYFRIHPVVKKMSTVGSRETFCWSRRTYPTGGSHVKNHAWISLCK